MSLLPEKSNPFDAAVAPSAGFIPPVDVYEQDASVIVETALPGVDPKDVEVKVEGDLLVITGKSEHRTEVDEKNYLYKEVRYGAFQRKVQLPKPVIGEQATTSSEHGLLRITLPKADEGDK